MLLYFYVLFNKIFQICAMCYLPVRKYKYYFCHCITRINYIWTQRSKCLRRTQKKDKLEEYDGWNYTLIRQDDVRKISKKRSKIQMK